jgi:uncharacterized membrane protein YqjE
MSSSDRSFGVVLQDIVFNIQEIVRAELRLAKTEVREELAKAGSASVLTAVGAAAAFFSAMFLLFAAMYALSTVMPAWAAALTVAVLIGAIAGVALSMGLKRFKTIEAAPRTVAQLKETIEWAKPHSK